MHVHCMRCYAFNARESMGEQSFETMPRLTLQERERALGLLEAGTSQTAVARRLHVNQSTISRLVSRHQQTGSVADRPRPGQLPVTTARQDRQIRLAHLRDRFRTAATTAANTIGRHGRRIHPITVRRRLRQAGLRPRRPTVVPSCNPDTAKPAANLHTGMDVNHGFSSVELCSLTSRGTVCPLLMEENAFIGDMVNATPMHVSDSEIDSVVAV